MEGKKEQVPGEVAIRLVDINDLLLDILAFRIFGKLWEDLSSEQRDDPVYKRLLDLVVSVLHVSIDAVVAIYEATGDAY